MIAIVGGGIMGLSVGWYLARRGASVTIFERKRAGHSATWAAAGMLTAWAVDPAELPFLKLQMASHLLWSDFVHDLVSASELESVGYRTEGRLFISLNHEDAAGLKRRYEFNRSQGIAAEWLTGDEARRLEPHLPPTVTNAIFLPSGHQVDNRLVAQALRTAFTNAGGVLREQTEVQEIIIDQNQVQGLRLSGKTVSVEMAVVTAGAWTSEITGLPPQGLLPIQPVKGQMLAVQMSPDAPLLRHVVTGNAYLIPRLGGRLLIGATEEKVGFDTEVTAGGIFHLLDEARQMLPAIDRLPIVESWAGLRPASSDSAPVVGATTVAGLFVATGHYRHGILLAPITAQAISQLILDGTVDSVIKPFHPNRFAP